MSEIDIPNGPFSYMNWNAALSGHDWQWIFEYPLFTDAHIIGEIAQGLGPYQLINVVRIQQTTRPALILRVHHHLDLKLNEMNKTQDEHYHGGYEADEIAALVALYLGIRLEAGGQSRIFGKNDIMGRPVDIGFTNDPQITSTQSIYTRSTIPSCLGQHSLEDPGVIATLPYLSPQDAIALIRAARMYQEAVWIVDRTPELSWLMLVSAIEVVAECWSSSSRQQSSISARDLLGSNLENILQHYGRDKADELIEKVAEELAPFRKATRKFLDFILHFLPPPPPKRPYEWAQHSWEKPAMKKTLDTIYRYRSRALHGGHPFPAPMCEAPYGAGENREFEEIPLGEATGMKGGIWLKKDTPILLHTFEYIARNTILNWWKSIVPN